MRQVNFFWSGTHGRFSPCHILTSTFCLLGTNVVSTQTRNLPVLEMAFPFPVMAPIFILSFFGFHFWKFSIWYGPQTGNLPLLVLDMTHFVPFPELGCAIFGTVLHWAPYWKWTLCAWSHFRYQALPAPVLSLLGSRTRTGLYVRGPISGTGLCYFRYRIHWAPYLNWTLCVWSHFWYRALPVLVRSLLGSRTGTGLYARGLISGTGLCHFWYGHFWVP